MALFNLLDQSATSKKNEILEAMARNRKNKKQNQRFNKQNSTKQSWAHIAAKENTKLDKADQALSLIARNDSKNKDHKGYYYKTHYAHRIEQCKAYWKDKDFKNLDHRVAWGTHNDELEKNGIPTIWDPNYEIFLRDTEDFWSGMSVDEVRADAAIARWNLHNEERRAAGVQPLFSDRVRPMRELPMYVPVDYMGYPSLPEEFLPRTVSDNPRYHDRPVKLAKTYWLGTNFILTPDVDARPWLAVAWNKAIEEGRDGTEKKDGIDSTVKDFANMVRVFQYDAPKDDKTSKLNPQAPEFESRKGDFQVNNKKTINVTRNIIFDKSFNTNTNDDKDAANLNKAIANSLGNNDEDAANLSKTIDLSLTNNQPSQNFSKFKSLATDDMVAEFMATTLEMDTKSARVYLNTHGLGAGKAAQKWWSDHDRGWEVAAEPMDADEVDNEG
jgi:hypothetical protein